MLFTVDCIRSVYLSFIRHDAIDSKSFRTSFCQNNGIISNDYNCSLWWNHYNKCAIISRFASLLDTQRINKHRRIWRERQRVYTPTLFANIERFQFIPTTFGVLMPIRRRLLDFMSIYRVSIERWYSCFIFDFCVYQSLISRISRVLSYTHLYTHDRCIGVVE